ncbi:MAG: hypothetical protein Q8N60_04700 [Candidatus Diapherotrites archaeon]|nr:hypothetical protein [Candidatus Diapherotrites archaeon]
MPEEDEEESPRRKKKGKRLSRKRVALLVIVLLIFSAGIFVQHFFVEPMFGELPEKYSRCMNQQQVLNDQFNDCMVQKGACEYQLQQCKGT